MFKKPGKQERVRVAPSLFAILIVLLLIWSYFARPIYDSAGILFGRAIDLAWERVGPRHASQSRETLVSWNTHSAKEIDAFLGKLASAENEAARAAAVDGAQASALRGKLKESLGFPPPALDLAVERRGVTSSGLLMLPKRREDWRFPNSLGALRDASVASLVCPRPLLVIAGDHDQLFPIAGARKTAHEVARIYAQRGVAASFEFFEFTGRHDFNGQAASRFVQKAFGAMR